MVKILETRRGQKGLPTQRLRSFFPFLFASASLDGTVIVWLLGPGQNPHLEKFELSHLGEQAAIDRYVSGVSGLEMAQNAQRLTWKPEEVDAKLQDMMQYIYDQMAEAEKSGGSLEEGANRAGFLKVAQAMKELGWVY